MDGNLTWPLDGQVPFRVQNHSQSREGAMVGRMALKGWIGALRSRKSNKKARYSCTVRPALMSLKFWLGIDPAQKLMQD